MAAVRTRHQLEDGARLPVSSRAEDDAGIGPFHAALSLTPSPRGGGAACSKQASCPPTPGARGSAPSPRPSPRKRGEGGYSGRGSLLLRKLQSHLAESLRIVAPVFAHLDEQKKVHRLLDQPRDLGARRGADCLDGGAALAEHDLALAFALHVDRLLDPYRAVAQLLPHLGLDRRAVGQLLVHLVEQLLAGDLSREAAQRRIR